MTFDFSKENHLLTNISPASSSRAMALGRILGGKKEQGYTLTCQDIVKQNHSHKGRSQCRGASGPLLWIHPWFIEERFDDLFLLNYTRITHMLCFLLFIGIFQMINGQMSSFLLLIGQHHPSFLSEMTRLLPPLLLLLH
jgi:hypothetical protein